MDKISTALKKLSVKEGKEIKNILKNIKLKQLSGFDIKKLKGHDNIFRVRKGNLRVIFLKYSDGVKILAIERKGDNTYNI